MGLWYNLLTEWDKIHLICRYLCERHGSNETVVYIIVVFRYGNNRVARIKRSRKRILCCSLQQLVSRWVRRDGERECVCVWIIHFSVSIPPDCFFITHNSFFLGPYFSFTEPSPFLRPLLRLLAVRSMLTLYVSLRNTPSKYVKNWTNRTILN